MGEFDGSLGLEFQEGAFWMKKLVATLLKTKWTDNSVGSSCVDVVLFQRKVHARKNTSHHAFPDEIVYKVLVVFD